MTLSTGVRAAAIRRAMVRFVSSLVVVLLSLALGLLIVAVAGYSPSATINSFVEGAFVGTVSIDTTIELAIPLVLASLAWIFAFRAGRINVGIEGQILMGGVGATLVGAYVHLPLALHLPLAVLGAAIAGAAYAGIAAALWAWRDVNEVISTFMLNLIAVLFVSYLVTGPLQEPLQAQPISDAISTSARWPAFFGQLSLSWDVVLMPVAVIAVAWTLHRTTLGFGLTVAGKNPEAARRAGVRTRRLSVVALLVSGGLAGLAGSSMLLGAQGGYLQQNFASNFGFYAIAVALVASGSPLGCIPTAILFAGLFSGGGLAEAQVGVDASLIEVVLGVVVVLSAASVAIAGRLRPKVGRARNLRSRATPGADKTPSAGVTAS